MVELRPYQEEAVQTVTASMLEDQFLFVQAATGSGKTIFFCDLLRRLLSEYKIKVAILAHRRELISQAHDKLLAVWPDAPIGIACASLNSVQIDPPVVIGTIQTLVNRLDTTDPFHMVIIDEAHRLPPKNQNSQYKTFLEKMLEQYAQLRVLGVTATPFRLGHGYIYGEKCKAGNENWFPKLHYSIGIQQLQNLGFLCPIRAKHVVDMDKELLNVSRTGGDYNVGQLSDLMCKEMHITSAVAAFAKYGKDSRHAVVFCVTIEHAELVMQAFRDAGYTAGVVHSLMSTEDRDGALRAFEAGEIRVLVNVGVLTEGWDSPHVDCILMCRPTQSVGLYIQMLGRGTRIYDGKTSLLVLDLSGNCHRHGNPDCPNVQIPGASPGLAGGRTAGTKDCPKCQEILPAQTMKCPYCGHVFKEEASPLPPSMQEINIFGKQQPPDIKPFIIERIKITPRDYVSKAGNRMLKLSILGYEPGKNIFPVQVNHFMDIEGNGSEYGKEKARDLWSEHARNADPPFCVEEALYRFPREFLIPERITIKQDGKYLKVARWTA